MPALTDEANLVYTDFVIPGVASSGEHEPVKREIRGLWARVDILFGSLAVNGAISVAKSTRALLYADLAHAADTLAVVYDDPTPAFNGIYAKVGGSGAGSWAITDLALPATFAADLAAVLAAAGEIEGAAAAVEVWAAEATAAAAIAAAAAATTTADAAAAVAAKNLAVARAAAAQAAQGASEVAADRAEAARDLAEIASLTAPNVYETEAAGLAATPDGETFWVQAAEGVALFRDVAGVADPLGVFLTPSTRAVLTVDSVAAAQAAAAPAANRVVSTLGHYFEGDGYSREYVFDPTSMIPDTEGSVLRPANVAGTAPGRLIAVDRQKFTGIAPLANVIESAVQNYAIAGQGLGKIWGIDRVAGEDLYTSDDGRTWTAYCETPSTEGFYRILFTDDGEALLQVGQKTIYRSSGFVSNPGAVTWDLVFDLDVWAGVVGQIEHFNLAGMGHKFIVTHYSASWPGQNWERYGWISFDGGATWEIKYDSRAIHGPTGNHGHMHGVAYDGWADTFYIIEGHGISLGVYYSYDDGDNWERIEFDVDPSNAPTTITPTDKGIVLTSDAEQQRGVLFIARPEDRTAVASMRIVFIHEIESPILVDVADDNLIGFGGVAYREPRTGIVYVGWHNSSSQHPFVTASDGEYSSTIYVETDEIGVDPNPVVARIVVTGADEFLASVINGDGTTAKDLVASVQYGLDKTSQVDPGRMWGGNARGTLANQNGSVSVGPLSRVDGRKGVAVGQRAIAGTDITTIESVAIGCGAEARGNKAIGIGGATTKANGASSINIGGGDLGTDGNNVRIGEGGNAGQSGVSIGHLAGNDGFGNINVGQSTNGQTAIGYTATGQTSVGFLAQSSVNDSTAVGQLAKATGNSAVAFGSQAEATHDGSAAIGQGVQTSAAAQVAVGAKHFEIVELAADPAAPSANRARFFARDNGSGKTQFCVRFPSGAVQVIATEP